MKRWMSRTVMVMALLFTSTALTGCYFTHKMMEIPKISDEEYQTEQQTEEETKEEETEGAEEQEETKEQEGIKEQEGTEEQEETEGQRESGAQEIPRTQGSNRQQGSQLQSAVPVSADPKGAGVASSAQEAKIRHIQEIYDRIVQEQGSYSQWGGRYYTTGGVLAKAVVSNGDPVLDEAMRKNGYQTYSLEYYYEDQPQVDSYPIYIYAVINEKVYRYYFCQGEFIRRIGPEGGGNTNDAPKMNDFIQTLRDEGAAYRREAENGQASAAWSAGAHSEITYDAVAPSYLWSHEEKIEYIQTVYGDIETGLMGFLKDSAGWYRDRSTGQLKKAIVSNGNETIDAAMRKNGYSTYVLEYYYDSDGYMADPSYPVLIHAVIDGKGYLYYFFGGDLIRRVGPEGGGNTNDAPQINSFIETLRDEGTRICRG